MKDKEFDAVADEATSLNAASGSRHDTVSCPVPTVEMHPEPKTQTEMLSEALMQ